MRNLKIGSRLALGFGIVLVLMLVLAGAGAWRLVSSQHAGKILRARQHTNVLVLQLARQVDLSATQAQALARLTDLDDKAAFQRGLDASSKRISALLAQLDKQPMSSRAQALYKSMKEARDHYLKRREEALKIAASGNLVDSYAFFHTEMPKLVSAYIDSLNTLSSFQLQSLSALAAAGQRESRLGLLILAVVGLAALLVGIVFAWLVSRSITRPLERAVDLADAVARRDLSRRVAPRGKDEIARLEHALGAMVEGLGQAVYEVRGGAESVATAANEIATGNMDLSSRTEQQASALAQAAAATAQITATVRQSAENAEHASGLADVATTTATNGAGLMANLADTMSQISAKSQKVAEIVGVIDSIAFQTNILALNAAVESARAGEQGRGFAVVAAEVRALAQRSAASAKEIKGLIDDSIHVIVQGNDQATQAGATMQDTVESIRRVTDLVRDISAASAEQAKGIEEISTVVARMDDVTHQNASMVEQSTSAAASLREQADALWRLVDTFRLTSGPGAQPQPEEEQQAPAPVKTLAAPLVAIRGTF